MYIFIMVCCVTPYKKVCYGVLPYIYIYIYILLIFISNMYIYMEKIFQGGEITMCLNCNEWINSLSDLLLSTVVGLLPKNRYVLFGITIILYDVY